MKFFLKSTFLAALAFLVLNYLSNIPGFALADQNASSNSTTTLALSNNAGSSFNWAGYVATKGTYTAVTGTWTVPSVAAGKSLGADAAWVGIGGINSNDLIQAGTQAVTASNGQVQYQAWYEMLPRTMHPVNLSVRAGDSITVSINQTSPDFWQVRLNNNSTGNSFTTSVQYNSSLSSAEWIQESPTSNFGLIPLDNFGTVQFTNGSTVKNGQSMTISQAGATPLNMINRAGQAIATSTILGSDGASFAVARTSASTSSSLAVRTFNRRGFSRTGVGVTGFSTTPRSNVRSRSRVFVINLPSFSNFTVFSR